MDESRAGIGGAPKRVEDERFLTGAGTYVDDMVLDGMVHAVVLRSPHAHARILGIETEDARAAPGVLTILTGPDQASAGIRPIAPYQSRSLLTAKPFMHPPRLPLDTATLDALHELPYTRRPHPRYAKAGDAIPAFRVVWPLLGSINQLLAALTLVGLSLWLAKSRRGLAIRAMVGLPMLFMMGVTMSALVIQIVHAPNTLLLTLAIVLLGLAAWITFEAVLSLWQGRPKAANA